VSGVELHASSTQGGSKAGKQAATHHRPEVSVAKQCAALEQDSHTLEMPRRTRDLQRVRVALPIAPGLIKGPRMEGEQPSQLIDIAIARGNPEVHA
jgi:hypothetical protein